MEVPSVEDNFEDDSGHRSISSDEDEEAPDVEELLWLAQMDIIGHRREQAIVRLRTAAALSSTAACVTLGNLLRHGSSPISKTRNLSQTQGTPLSTSQTVDRPKFRQAHSRPLHEDAFEAATLFVKGLEAELKKPLKESGTSEESEEESAEGLTFSLERALDLAIGVTHSYTTFWGNIPSDPTERVLWERGGEVALQALQHPEICTTLEPGLFLSNSPPPPPLPSRGTRPLLSGGGGSGGGGGGSSGSINGSRNRSESSSRKLKIPPARSYAHPSTSIPPPATFVPSSYKASGSHHLPPRLKLHLTIQVHLCYVLAIYHFSLKVEEKAERYWKDIVKISKSSGGSIGTREGDEIVSKATHRLVLFSNNGVDDSWKFAKKRKPHGVTRGKSVDHVEKQNKVQALEANHAHSHGNRSDLQKERGHLRREGSGDAIVDMRLEAKLKGRRQFKISDSSERRTGTISRADITEVEELAPETSEIPTTCTTEREPRGASNATVSYPSPPETPRQSPEPSENGYAQGIMDKRSDSMKNGSGLRAKHKRGVRSVDSINLPSLFKRVPSAASLSTLADSESFLDERQSTETCKLEGELVLWTGWNAVKYPFRAMHSFMYGSRSEKNGTNVYAVLEKIQEADWKANFDDGKLDDVTDDATDHNDQSRAGEVLHSETITSLTSVKAHNNTSDDNCLQVPHRSRRRSVAMDPLLKELENASRVGVKTVCATCGRRGLNYPKNPRTGQTHCSRECRVKVVLAE